jgi:cardiolipin synthase
MEPLNRPYHLFSSPANYYESLVNDIKSAKYYVYVETFRIGRDSVGEEIRAALIDKAGQGVEVKVLIDYWGNRSLESSFFKALTDAGGEVRFFEKIKFNTDMFTRGHRRNHRKIQIIDDRITYIGSSNLTGYNVDWRESILRMEDDIALKFKSIFLQDYRVYRKYVLNVVYYSKKETHNGFDILRDVPNIAVKKINYRFIKMINEAKQRVTIETPYFLPGFLLRKAMINAVKRGVEVQVIMPVQSDVNIVDILRNKYLGPLSQSGIQLLLYKKNNLHAKLMLVDDNTFAIGSSNFDYRSFRYMFEIMLIGHQEAIVDQVKKHIHETISGSAPFNYEHWQNRPYINKLFEWLIVPFRHYL